VCACCVSGCPARLALHFRSLVFAHNLPTSPYPGAPKSMKKRVLLVNSSYKRWPVERFFFQYFPRGLLCIAGELRRRLPEVEVRLVDMTLGSQSETELLQALNDFQPDFIGVTIHATPTIPSSKRLIALIRSIVGDSVEIAAGGTVPTFFGPKTFDFVDVDYVFRGYAEYSLPELLAQRPNPAPVFSLVGAPTSQAEEDSTILVNPRRRRLGSASALEVAPNAQFSSVGHQYRVYPAYDLLEMDRYKANGVVPHLELSRGCPFSCNFCGVHLDRGRAFLRRDVSNAVDEIEFLNRDCGFQFFAFADDTLTTDRRHILAVIAELERRDLHIEYRALTRLDLLDEELLQALRRSGCTEIGVGVESSSNTVLAQVEKGLNVGQIERGLEMVRNSGISLLELAIFGFENETHSDVLSTMRFLHVTRPSVTLPLIFHPMPGTIYFDQYLEQMVKENRDELFELVDQTAPPMNDTKHLSIEDLTKYFIWFHYGLPTLIDPTAREEFVERMATNTFPRLRKGVVFTRLEGQTVIYTPQLQGQIVPELDIYRRSFNLPMPTPEELALDASEVPNIAWDELVYELLLVCNGDFTSNEIRERLRNMFSLSATTISTLTEYAFAALEELQILEMAAALDTSTPHGSLN